MIRRAAARAARLREEIARHDHLYYVLDRPEISDFEYDRLFEELVRIEAAHPDLVTASSPTQRVGGQPSEAFPTVVHLAPMLSLEAVREPEEVRRFDQRVRQQLGGAATYLLQPKLDGVSLELVYEKGALARAVTRGDGARGEEVTGNARTIRSIPLELRREQRSIPDRLAVRGEVMMTISAFGELNSALLEKGEPPFANPRNAAAGSLRQLDPRITAARPLHLEAYEILHIDGARPDRDHEALEALQEWGFRTPGGMRRAEGVDEILDYHTRWEAERDSLDFEIDGIVCKLDDLEARARIGATSRHPRWALAVKFEPRREVTRVQEIAVQVGRTGALTPVAVLRPVHIGGVTVVRATLHNAAEVERKDIRIGDLVRVHRAGDVIPEIVERIPEPGRERGPPFRMPAHCPSCGEAVVAEGPLTYCPNRLACPAQLAGALVHFASRSAMDIPGLGPETAAALVDRGIVGEPAALYRLKPDDLLVLPHFGERSAAKLVEGIAARRTVSLDRLVYALGIPGVGSKTAHDLAAVFPSIDAIRDATAAQLRAVPGLGPVVAARIEEFFADPRNRGAVDALIVAGVRGTPMTGSRRGPLAGKTLVLTGALPDLTRAEAEERIRTAGGRVTGSVSSTTDFVLAGADPGTKLDEARRRKIPVIDQGELLRILGETESGG